MDRIAYSAERRSTKSQMRTEFILQPDLTNKHKIDAEVHKTVVVPNSIPFLRDIRNVSSQKFHQVVSNEM